MDGLMPLVDSLFRESRMIVSFVTGAVAAYFLMLKSREDFRRNVNSIIDNLIRMNEEYKKRWEVTRGELEEYQKEISQAENQFNRLERRLDEHKEKIASLETRLGSTHTLHLDPARTEPETDRSKIEPDWKEAYLRLERLGIAHDLVDRLRNACSTREIKLIDSDGRERIRVLSDNESRLPVAIIWRGAQTHRVLFPDGSDRRVEVGSLTVP